MTFGKTCCQCHGTTHTTHKAHTNWYHQLNLTTYQPVNPQTTNQSTNYPLFKSYPALDTLYEVVNAKPVKLTIAKARRRFTSQSPPIPHG